MSSSSLFLKPTNRYVDGNLENDEGTELQTFKQSDNSQAVPGKTPIVASPASAASTTPSTIPSTISQNPDVANNTSSSASITPKTTSTSSSVNDKAPKEKIAAVPSDNQDAIKLEKILHLIDRLDGDVKQLEFFDLKTKSKADPQENAAMSANIVKAKEILSQEKKNLVEHINQSTARSPKLFLNFLQHIAVKYSVREIDFLCEIINIFKQANFFKKYLHETKRVHELLIDLVVNLQLLTKSTSEQRKKILLSGIESFPEQKTDNIENTEGKDTNFEPTIAELNPLADPSIRIELLMYYINQFKTAKAKAIYLAEQKENKVRQEVLAQEERNSTAKRRLSELELCGKEKLLPMLGRLKLQERLPIAKEMVETEQEATNQVRALYEKIKTANQKNLFRPNDWASYLNDFVSVYALTGSESANILSFLNLPEEEMIWLEDIKQEQALQLLPPHLYLPELMIRFLHSPIERANVLKTFLFINTNDWNDVTWILRIFEGLYEEAKYNSNLTDDVLYSLIDEMMQKFQESAKSLVDECPVKLAAEIPLIPLTAFWCGDGNHANPVSSLPFKSFALQWMQREDVNCFKNVDKYNFFRLVLYRWVKELESNAKELSIFIPKRTKTDEMKCQVIPPETLLNNKACLYIYYLMLLKLSPLVHDESKFNTCCVSLFHGLLAPTEINTLYGAFVKNEGLPPDNVDELVSFVAVIQHRLASHQLTWDTINLQKFFEYVLPLDVIATYQDTFVEGASQLSQSNCTEGQSATIDILEGDHLLLPGNLIKARLNLQLTYSYFLQIIVNRTKYEALQSIPYFSSVPRFLQNKPHLRETVCHLLLDDGEEKAEYRVDKGEAFFRALANPENYHNAEVNVDPDLFLEEKYGHLIYYKLLQLKINIKFYEYFANKNFAQKYILEFARTPFFQLLYGRALDSHTETRLVNLLGIPKNNQAVINADVLARLFDMQRLVETDSIAETELYFVLRNIILHFDKMDTDLSLLLNILNAIRSIIERFNRTEAEATIAASFLREVNKALLATNAVEIFNNINKVLDRARSQHPCVTDVSSFKEPVISFISKLHQRGRLKDFNDYPNYLKELLDTFVTLNADGQREAFLQLIHGGVGFINSRAPDDMTWLESVWKSGYIIICLELLKLGVVASDSFLNEFLDAVSIRSELLQDRVWRDTFILLTAERSLTHKITAWLVRKTTEEKSEQAVTFVDLFQYIDVTYLPNLALAFIEADKFELLFAVNAVYKKRKSKDIWANEAATSMRDDFHKAFTKVLNLTNVNYDYTYYIQCPGFFTSYHHLMRLFDQNYNSLTSIHIALRTVNGKDGEYTETKGKQYLDSFERFTLCRDKWSTIVGVKIDSNLWYLIVNAIYKHAAELSLNDVTRIFNCIVELRVAAFYPFESELRSIFSKPAKEWYDALTDMHAKLQSFQIAQADPVEVKNKFLNCNPSFNHLINKAGGTYTSIDYFFHIFGIVTARLSEDTTKKTLTNSLHELDQYFPGQWNEQNDANFFTRLCVTSRDTIGMTPYHSQFVTIMGSAIYAVPDFTKKLLVEMATGQGKTITIAFSAACFIKMHPKDSKQPLKVPVVTLTDNLGRNNVGEMGPFFNGLGIVSDKDIRSNASISYTTGLELLFYYSGLEVAAAFGDNMTMNMLWRMIVDEVDVDLFDRNLKFVSVTGETFKEFNAILRIIWNGVITNKLYSEILHSVYVSNAFKALPDFLQEHFKLEFNYFVDKAKQVNNDPAVLSSTDNPTSGAIVREEKETGIVSDNSFDRNGGAQFRQMKRGVDDEQLTNYSLPNNVVYYDDIFKTSSRILSLLGFSGTLVQQMRAGLVNKGFQIVETARFNAQNRKDLPSILCNSEDEWNQRVYDTIMLHVNNGLPVVIFLKDRAELSAFYQKHFANKNTPGKVNVVFGTETPEEYDRIVLEAAEAQTITLGTIVFGRGVDIKVINKSINDKGGLVVLEAFVNDAFNVSAQLLGRTARGDNPGITQTIILCSELVSKLKQNALNADVTQDNFVQKILLLREKVMAMKFASVEEHKKSNFPYILKQDFYDQVLPRGGDRANRLKMYNQFLVCSSLAVHDKSKGVQQYNDYFNRRITVPKNTIAVCIAIDCTMSMIDQFQAAKRELCKLPQMLKESHPDALLQVGIILVTDYECQWGYKSKTPEYWLEDNTLACEMCDFTENINQALDFLNAKELRSNTDTNEAYELVFGTARKRLHWPKAMPGGRVSRVVVFAADSRGHGYPNLLYFSGVVEVHYPKKKSNPAQLDCVEEAQKLREEVGADVYVLDCSEKLNVDMYQLLVGTTGAVIALNKADQLITEVSKCMKASDQKDEMLALFVSQGSSNAEVVQKRYEQLKQAQGSSSSTVSDQALRDMAAAEVAGYNQRRIM